MPIDLVNKLAELEANVTLPMSALKTLAHADEPIVTARVYDFSSGFVVYDGQDPKTEGKGWIDSWRKWGVRTLNEGNGDILVKKADPGLTHVAKDTSLVLQAGFKNNSPVGGMISFEDRMRFTRGAVEVKANILQIHPGYHLAMWMVPVSGDWPPEYDMMEVVNQGEGGKSNGKVHFNHHAPKGSVDRPPQRISAVPLTDGYHTYRLESTDETVKWFYDGELVRRTAMTIEEPHYFLITWEGGGRWPGPITDRSLVSAVEIEHVTIELQS